MSIAYEFDERPQSGGALRVADGLFWLRMPLPFALNHINLWLARDDAGWTIFETGIGNKETLEIWPRVFAEAMADDPATQIVVTHMHPDHVGCAGYLARHFDASFWMTRDEYLLCRILVADTGRVAPAEGVEFYRAAGLSEEQLDDYVRAFGFFGRFVTPLPESYRRLTDGHHVNTGNTRWEVVTGSGHSPRHASFYDAERNLLIAGDQVLPTISPNVGVWPTEPLANPLAEWLDSLKKIKSRVPEDVLVLPSHGKPFRGAHDRLDALIEEHETRLERLLECCRTPVRVVDTFSTIFKSEIKNNNRIMAVGESMSHLNYLIDRGDVAVELKDGVKWFLKV